MNAWAYNTIYLHFSDIVLRKVTSITTTLGIWKKLDELYVVRNLPNKIYPLKRFFGFKMDLSKDLDEKLDEINKITMALVRNGKKFTYEHIVVMLLNALPYSYNSMRDAIKLVETL